MSNVQVTSSFDFRAILSDGSLTNGRIFAESRESALLSLQDRGLYPTQVRATSSRFNARRSAPLDDLALGFRMLATLLDAGLSMNKALSAFGDVAPQSWKPTLTELTENVRHGKSLGDALSTSSLGVPAVVIGILRAGEAGSGIAPALIRAAEIVERSANTRRAIYAALAYPALLVVTGGLSATLLVGFVLPRFAAILTELNQNLPASTRAVLAAAGLVRIVGLPVLICAIGLLSGWWLWSKTERGRIASHSFLFHVPLIGKARRCAATAHAAAALSALLESGVPLVAALPHAARASGDAAEERMLAAARELVVAGERPSVAFDRTASLTPTAVRLVAAGEESGRLARMLDHAATIEAARAEQTIRGAVRLLEPFLILVFAGAIALVAAALLQAVYSVRAGV